MLFSIDRIRRINIEAYISAEAYRRYILANFPPPGPESDNRITLFCHGGPIEALRSFGYDLSQLVTPCVGLFDADENVALISGPEEYGLFKSTAVGLHSRLLLELEWTPIHAAAISCDGLGVVITGYHGAGKSTALLNLLHYGRAVADIRVLTDDWSVARLTDASVTMCSIEDRMSFGLGLVRDNPELNLMQAYQAHIVDGLDKAWAHIDDVLGAGTYEEEAILRRVLLFSPADSRALIRPVPTAAAVELLVDSSYHMPDTGPDTTTRLAQFWTAALRDVECIEISNRHERRDKSEIYPAILEYLLT